MASHLHSAVGEILFWDSELISRAKLSSVVNDGAVRAIPFAHCARTVPVVNLSRGGHAYVGRTQGVASFSGPGSTISRAYRRTDIASL